MTEDRDTTHIRVKKELKEELDQVDGYNYTDRIRNFAIQSDSGEPSVNQMDEFVDKLKSEIGNSIGNSNASDLTYDDIRNAVEGVLDDARIDQQRGVIEIDS